MLKAGSVILFDYRVVHRGTANTTKDTNREMFYAVYAKPWFNVGASMLLSCLPCT